jgi:hypothetical protein
VIYRIQFDFAIANPTLHGTSKHIRFGSLGGAARHIVGILDTTWAARARGIVAAYAHIAFLIECLFPITTLLGRVREPERVEAALPAWTTRILRIVAPDLVTTASRFPNFSVIELEHRRRPGTLFSSPYVLKTIGDAPRLGVDDIHSSRLQFPMSGIQLVPPAACETLVTQLCCRAHRLVE